MFKSLSKLSVITLILIMALSFVGCGGGGGNGDGPTTIEGYWRVKSTTEGSETEKFPDIADMSEEVPDFGISGKIQAELFLGFNNNKFYEYYKYTFIDFDAVEREKLYNETGCEEGVFYEVVSDHYSISGSTVSYTDDSYSQSGTIKMTFQIAEKNATITREYPDGSKETILAEKTDSSAVKGAKEKPEDPED